MDSVGFARVGGIDVFSNGVILEGDTLLALGDVHCVFCGGLVAQVQRKRQRKRRVVGGDKLQM